MIERPSHRPPVVGARLVGTLILLLVASTRIGLCADDILVLVDDVPPHGLVVGEVDLTAAAKWCSVTPVAPTSIRAELMPDESPVPVQFVPAAGFDPVDRVAGTVLLKLPAGGPVRVRLRFDAVEPATPVTSGAEPFDGTVMTDAYRMVHDRSKLGGLPSRFEFTESGKVFEQFRWNDRVYDRTWGSFGLAYDPQPRVERVSDGPLATVVRVRARYMRADHSQPDSRPEAIYDWCYFRDLSLVRVTATATQQPSQAWSEIHFLELNFPGDDFSGWAGGEPLSEGVFTGETRSFYYPSWGALVEGRDTIAMFDCGRALFYDHRGGSYLHAHGDRAWKPWSAPHRQWSAWLWIGATDHVAKRVRAAMNVPPTRAGVDVTVASVDSQIQAARHQWQTQTAAGRRQTWWHAAGAAQLAARGRFQEALQTAQGLLPDHWAVLQAGELGLIFAEQDQGISLQSLFDAGTGRELLSADNEPLFEMTLRHVETKEEIRLAGDAGWQHAEIVADDGGSGVELRWSRPADERLGAVNVTARATSHADTSSVAWQLKVASSGNQWALWRVVFPKIALREMGRDTQLFVPQAAGQVETGVSRRAFQFGGRYPSGWTSMQYMAVYAADRSTGLYVAVHDPFGSTKQINAQSHPVRHSVNLSFDHPVPDMGKPGNHFELCGAAVWQFVRGDWFDAAMIYRAWVREHATWYPERTDAGRADTPRWMRELAVSALGGGDPKSGLPVLQEFAREMDLPVGFHWYNWHQIPFDNDYPHYFPADEGFAAAVELLQQRGIFVMPYINGRLWDTHDRGAEDFEFSKLALPAATKDEQGQPYVETYGSRETDGSKVELAAMCPSTELWQARVRGIVSRLISECGVWGVYIDQVAAAKPQLCFDASHDHPTGGGHWWIESYGKMLAAIRREMPDDRILTTECNAEPYLKWFDGYLTWHWQYNGQVPAFPAVYGGAIQMFGRAYRAGPTKDLALRMKAGQQLVFGEQIGWIDPGVVREKENFAFLRQIVHLRWQLRRYFFAGQMARPPQLQGNIPTVTADWQWSGVWPVTTRAAMTGAWQLPDENRAVVLLVNVSDQPLAIRVECDAGEYGVAGDQVQVSVLGVEGRRESFVTERVLRRRVTLPARTAVAWEIEPLEVE